MFLRCKKNAFWPCQAIKTGWKYNPKWRTNFCPKKMPVESPPPGMWSVRNHTHAKKKLVVVVVRRTTFRQTSAKRWVSVTGDFRFHFSWTVMENHEGIIHENTHHSDMKINIGKDICVKKARLPTRRLTFKKVRFRCASLSTAIGGTWGVCRVA